MYISYVKVDIPISILYEPVLEDKLIVNMFLTICFHWLIDYWHVPQTITL
jgi:hypothetical protein